MERPVRARFLVFRVNRILLAILLMLLLILIFSPSGGIMPAIAPGDLRIRQGVTMLGRDFSGRTEAEARSMLDEMQTLLASEPVEAREIRNGDGLSYVIPELNGYTLDVDSTLFRLSVAAEGSRVEPARRISTPARRLGDYPGGVIRTGNADKPAVALLINVDWGTRELVQMLPVLKRRGVRATFFVSGRWADENKELLKTIAGDGHELASHGYDLTVGPLALARAGKLRPDLERSVASIEGATGRVVRYWAPHMSELSPDLVRTAADLNLRTVLYSLDTIDWRDSTTPEMILTRTARAKAGDLILMHPKPTTAAVLERLIQALQARHLQPVTLTELISPDPGEPDSAYARPHE